MCSAMQGGSLQPSVPRSLCGDNEMLLHLSSLPGLTYFLSSPISSFGSVVPKKKKVRTGMWLVVAANIR